MLFAKILSICKIALACWISSCASKCTQQLQPLQNPKTHRFHDKMPIITQPIPLSPSNHREFCIPKTRISVAPAAASSSITLAISFFGTIELIAQAFSSSSEDTVGALFPGVMLLTCSREERAMLYWQRTYFCASV